MKFPRSVLPLFGLLATLPAHAGTIDAMKWHRRILIVSSPEASDPLAAAQRRILASWQRQAADRDVTVVEIAGDRVTGASDAAPTLRRRYSLPARRFEALLIGKDGSVAMREIRPIEASALQTTIDAMPMRRAGER